MTHAPQTIRRRSGKNERASGEAAREEQMRIGQLAKATGIQVETIRFYEREGLLLEGARTDANYRLYADAHVDRLAFIRQCRLLDMPLDEIRTLLRFRDKPGKSQGARELLTTCIKRAAGRIQDLKRLQAELKVLLAQSARVRSPD